MPKVTVWLTGLPGAGKTTIATVLRDMLAEQYVELWDGDQVRNRFRRFGFTRADREAHIRHVVDSIATVPDNTVVIASFVSPFRDMRAYARKSLSPFCEVFVNAPLLVCEKRDPKGMYKKARAGEIAHFTGVDDPYEVPPNPDVTVHTDRESAIQSAEKVFSCIDSHLAYRREEAV